MQRLFKLAALTALIACSAGCASVMDGELTAVKINSEPTGAKVSVFDREGKPVYAHTTPARFQLNPSRGYMAGEKYKVVFEAPGYYPATQYIESHINGWYFGNIVLGGPIGLFAIDPLTGAMFKLSPTELNWNLVPSTVALSPDELKAAELKANPPKSAKSTQAKNDSSNR